MTKPAVVHSSDYHDAQSRRRDNVIDRIYAAIDHYKRLNYSTYTIAECVSQETDTCISEAFVYNYFAWREEMRAMETRYLERQGQPAQRGKPLHPPRHYSQEYIMDARQAWRACLRLKYAAASNDLSPIRLNTVENTHPRIYQLARTLARHFRSQGMTSASLKADTIKRFQIAIDAVGDRYPAWELAASVKTAALLMDGEIR